MRADTKLQKWMDEKYPRISEMLGDKKVQLTEIGRDLKDFTLGEIGDAAERLSKRGKLKFDGFSKVWIASDGANRQLVVQELVKIAKELMGKKGEVPEAFKKEWKNQDKDGDGKENEPKPDFLKEKEKKGAERLGAKDDEDRLVSKMRKELGGIAVFKSLPAPLRTKIINDTMDDFIKALKEKKGKIGASGVGEKRAAARTIKFQTEGEARDALTKIKKKFPKWGEKDVYRNQGSRKVLRFINDATWRDVSKFLKMASERVSYETTKDEWEKALKVDEASLVKMKRDLKTLQSGGKVKYLTEENAKKIIVSLEQVIANKKALVKKLTAMEKKAEDEVTDAEKEKALGEFSKHTGGEPVSGVLKIRGRWTVFTTELGAYRIARKYRSDWKDVGPSRNVFKGSWYVNI